MSVPENTIWKAEPHTLAKHRILKNYLGAWFKILLDGGYPRLTYIDGFCGPGIYEGGEQGSPIIAIDVAKKCVSISKAEQVDFLFIDEDKSRLDTLEEEIQKIQFPNKFKKLVKHGEFHTEFLEILRQWKEKGNQLPPTFAFIDPFGYAGVPYELIRELLRHNKSELFITFMAKAVNRWLTDESKQAEIKSLLGLENTDEIINATDDRVRKLVLTYETQLRKCSANLFIRSFQMCGKNDETIYYLIFATHSPKGHVEMKNAMWKVDEQGDFRFSDARDPNQELLISHNHAEALLKLLNDKFVGTTVSGEVVRKFVEDETIYLNKHKTTALKTAEELKRIEVSKRKSNYPDGCQIRFL
jgi:three-Cys-motif partner protein